MIDAKPVRSEQIGLILAGLGGAGSVLQALLPWQQDTQPNFGPPDSTYAGSHQLGGVFIALVGVVVLALSGYWFLRDRSYDSTAWLLILGIIIGAAAVLSFVPFAIQLSNRQAEAASLGAVYGDTIGLGLYLAVISGPLTAIGALIGLRDPRR
jgi:hypothetical protein